MYLTDEDEGKSCLTKRKKKYIPQQMPSQMKTTLPRPDSILSETTT